MGPTTSPASEAHHPPPHKTPKSLIIAIWLLALSLLTIAACTIYIAVLSQSFLDTSEKHLTAIGNNTRAIFAALADDSLDTKGFRYGTWGSQDHLSLRSNLGRLRQHLDAEL
ncbi:hypothetical protein BJX66DRAFT_345268 [Aspergillus keveii]|uniref:Uncharacterized protein n=1 Tax=Aspergillus keveii TaxID=714993 RepID=A0ABR4FIL2_9EURO